MNSYLSMQMDVSFHQGRRSTGPSRKDRSGNEGATNKASRSKEKKPNEPTKLKSRIVACGNYDKSENEKDTNAGGADVTAVRTAIRIATLQKWTIRTKDVSTAFLNADYVVKGEILLLRPPYIYVKAGLIEADEYWIVKKAIFGLKESPLLWSTERDKKLSQLTIEKLSKEDPTVKE